jgi:hypothetical protein
MAGPCPLWLARQCSVEICEDGQSADCPLVTELSSGATLWGCNEVARAWRNHQLLRSFTRSPKREYFLALELFARLLAVRGARVRRTSDYLALVGSFQFV